MMRRPRVPLSRRAAVSFCLALVHLSCGPSKPTPEVATKPPSSTVAEGARWAFHPLKKASTADEIEYRGGRVEVDRSGSRWLILPGHDPEVSPFGAPEPLTAIVKAKTRFAFVGDSGTVYFSEQPLSPLQQPRTPPERFVLTRRAGRALLALSADGEIFRSSDLGKRWDRVGPTDRRFAELAVAGDGTVVTYSVPEQWARSVDGGKTFEPLKVKSQAPSRLDRLDTGDIYVLGLYDSTIYRRGRFEEAEPLIRRALSQQRKSNQYSLPKFAEASTVQAGRAVLSGEQYIALTATTGGIPWKISSGSLESPLRKRPVKGLKSCGAFRMVGAATHTAVGCAQGASTEVAPLLHLYRATKVGADYAPVKGVFRGGIAGASMAMSSRGELAVAGLCTVPEKGCTPSGVTLITPSGKVSHVHVPGVPVPRELAYDDQGRLWLYGARKKDGHHILFGPVGDHAKVLDLTSEANFDRTTNPKAIRALLLPGADGLLSVALSHKRSQVALVDDRARLLSTAAVPSGVTSLHGAGRHLAGLDPTEGLLWESTTGGLSWDKHALPRDLCSGAQSECHPSIVCSQSGCLVGDELSRLGWGRGGSHERLELPYQASSEEQFEPGIGFECKTNEGDWTPLVGLSSAPTAYDASLGEAAWTAPLADQQRAALTMVRVEWGKKELLYEELLPPQLGGNYVFHVNGQIEGAVAVRYPRPQGLRARVLGVGAPRKVEVAWDNRLTGDFGYAEVDHPAITRAMEALSSGLRGGNGKPEVLSVAGHGVYLKMPNVGGLATQTLFITGRGKQTQITALESVQWPELSTLTSSSRAPSVLEQASVERVRIGGQHEALARLANGRMVSLTQGLLEDGTFTSVKPYRVGLESLDASGYAQRVHLGYLGDQLGYLSMQFSLEGSGHQASFVRLDPNEGFREPIAVPLQHDLVGPVLPCSASERGTTPRVIAPSLDQLQRRVVVTGLDRGLLELVTDSAVVQGTPEQPCVATFEAKEKGAKMPVAQSYSALVFPDETESSWLFSIQRSSQGVSTISVRSMDCRAERSVTD